MSEWSPPAQVPIPEAVGDGADVLTASGIEKTYASPSGRLEVLRGVDLKVKRGTVLAIVGVSGAKAPSRSSRTLDRPDRGTLAIRGERVEGMSEESLARFRARRIGFVFQFHHLLPEFTAEENVMMPMLIAGAAPADARTRAREVLTAVGLAQRWEHRPAELSGGEAQRVAVARALAPEPELVLADETSGNLDPAAAGTLQDLLATLARERHQTFVIVTHNDRLASLADRVLKLDAGRLEPV
jgi:lipoprotein-releasing system ATP-binding protein